MLAPDFNFLLLVLSGVGTAVAVALGEWCPEWSFFVACTRSVSGFLVFTDIASVVLTPSL